MDKKYLRHHMLTRRNQMTIEEHQAKDAQILAYLKDVLKDKKDVGIYLSFGSEVSTFPLLAWLLKQDKRVYSSKIVGKDLIFYPIVALDQLVRGQYDILYPDGQNAIEKNRMEVMLIPLLVYDNHGNRIGYGKGYYDRYLNDYNGLKIGVAYAFQRVDIIEMDSTDIPLDAIITEKGLHYI